MDDDLYLAPRKWIKAGSLVVDLLSLEEELGDLRRRQQETWDYLAYRESLVKWPLMNETIRGGRRA